MTTLPNLGDSGLPTRIGPGPDPSGTTLRSVGNGGAVGPVINAARVSSRLDTVLRIGMSARPRRRDYSIDTPLGRAVRCHDALLAQLREFAVKAGEVVDSDQYTPIGRQNRLKSIGADFLLRVNASVGADTMKPAVQRIRDRAAADISDALKSPASDPVEPLFIVEARGQLYSMSPQQRLEAWKTIVDTRDTLGLAAVMGAPKFAPLFSDQIVAEGVKVLVEAKNPKAVQVRDDANEALFSMEAMLDDARKMIADASGIDLTPPREGLSAAGGGT